MSDITSGTVKLFDCDVSHFAPQTSLLTIQEYQLNPEAIWKTSIQGFEQRRRCAVSGDCGGTQMTRSVGLATDVIWRKIESY